MPPKRKVSRIARAVGYLLRTIIWAVLLFVVLSAILVLSLRWINPPTSAFMLAYQLSTDRTADYHWVNRQEISEYLAIAAVAAEDQRFPYHHGLDFAEIENAIRDYQQGERLRGASTITQQVAKNLFLWNGRSLLRKLLELYFTVLIEWLWSKERILEIYLNIAEFDDGVYGVERASERYFRRSARQINLQQACLMVAVLPNPKSFNLSQPSRYHRNRARVIEVNVKRLGGIQHLRGQ